MNPEYLLDTSIIIAHLHRHYPEATKWIERAATKEIKCAISSLTHFELWVGAIDPSKERQYKIILSPFKVYGVSKDIAQLAAEMFRSIPKNQQAKELISDILIAATAEYHRFGIITTNKNHFSRFNVTVERIYLNS